MIFLLFTKTILLKIKVAFYFLLKLLEAKFNILKLKISILTLIYAKYEFK